MLISFRDESGLLFVAVFYPPVETTAAVLDPDPIGVLSSYISMLLESCSEDVRPI